MKQTYSQWLKEQADIIIRVGNNVPDVNIALMDGVECNEQTGLSVLVADENGKYVYFINVDGFIEYV